MNTRYKRNTQTAGRIILITVFLGLFSTIIHADDPPIAVINASSHTTEWVHPVTLDGKKSSDDKGIARYVWEFGARQYSFKGTSIQKNLWRYTDSVTQNDTLVMSGKGSWGTTYIFSHEKYLQGSQLVATLSFPPEKHHMLIGFKDTSQQGKYTTFPFALYFNNGALQVYENGKNRGTFGNYVKEMSYEIRIALKELKGAQYYYRQQGAAQWILLYDSNYSKGSVYTIGIDVYSGRISLSDCVIERCFYGEGCVTNLIPPTGVTLIVYDSIDQSDTATMTINAANPPNAVIISEAGNVIEGPQVISLLGAASANDIGIVSYEWDLSNGTQSSDTNISVFIDAKLTALLTVTDQQGQKDSDTDIVDVTIGNPPKAIITAPDVYPLYLSVPFNALLSTDDFGIVSRTWDFGDGSAQETDMYVFHTYKQPGIYEVTLTVYDNAGQSDQAKHTITLHTKGGLRSIPWQIVGTKEIPHKTYSGKEITIKAVGDSIALPALFTVDCDDGSPLFSIPIPHPKDLFALEVKHTYQGNPGTIYEAKLTLADANGVIHTDTYPVKMYQKEISVEKDIAVDEGLWYLHKQVIRVTDSSGTHSHWDGIVGGYTLNATGSAIQVFQLHNHYQIGNPKLDPYVETIQMAIRYLLLNLQSANIGNQPHGNPDANGNGIGLTYTGTGTIGSRIIYELSSVINAFVTTGTPDYISPVGGSLVKGRRLSDIVQDMVDMYSWGQTENGQGRGGWQYIWNIGSDNSAAQWAAVGLITAERYWNIIIPQFVKNENNLWLNSSFNGSHFGYTNGGSGSQLNGTTPGGMVQLAFIGRQTSDHRWIGTEKSFANTWNAFLDGYSIYGAFAFTKAMRTALPKPVVTFKATGLDWYNHKTNGLLRFLIDKQTNDGSWKGKTNTWSKVLDTAWVLLILSPMHFYTEQ